MNVEDLNLYFEEDDGGFYIKHGYACIHSGFVDTYITIITTQEEQGRYIFMSPDDDYGYSGDWSDVDVYELTKVT